MPENSHLFLSDRRTIRSSVRGMWVISALIAICLTIAAFVLFVNRLGEVFQTATALTAAAALMIAFFSWRSVKSLAITYITSADIITDEQGVLLCLTDRLKMRITAAALTFAQQVEVPPHSSFHPDRADDRAYLITFADKRLALCLTAAAYGHRGRGAFLVTSDHDDYQALLGSFTRGQ